MNGPGSWHTTTNLWGRTVVLVAFGETSAQDNRSHCQLSCADLRRCSELLQFYRAWFRSKNDVVDGINETRLLMVVKETRCERVSLERPGASGAE
jgi:hypothetical protein